VPARREGQGERTYRLDGDRGAEARVPRSLEPKRVLGLARLEIEHLAQAVLLDLALGHHELLGPHAAVHEVEDVEHDHVPRRVVVRVGLRRHGEEEVEDALALEGDDHVGLERRVLDGGGRGRRRVAVDEVGEVAEDVQDERNDVLVLGRALPASEGNDVRQLEARAHRGVLSEEGEETHLRLLDRLLARMIIMCLRTLSLRMAALYERCAWIRVV